MWKMAFFPIFHMFVSWSVCLCKIREQQRGLHRVPNPKNVVKWGTKDHSKKGLILCESYFYMFYIHKDSL